MKTIDLQDGEIIKKYIHKEITFYITNFGRIFNINGKLLKPQLQRVKDKSGWNPSLKIQLNIRTKKLWVRYSLGLARVVYKSFVDENISEWSRIVFRDGNHLNCRWDNLSIGLEHQKVERLTREQLKLLNSPYTMANIKKALLWYYKNPNIIVNEYMTLDDLTQEAVILITKALPNYKHESMDRYGGWVFTLVRRFICDRYRMKRTRNIIYNDGLSY